MAIWLDGPNKVFITLSRFTHTCATREVPAINRPAVSSVCDLAHQVCCCSTPCWPSERTRPTPTKTKAGRPSPTRWCSGSATTWKASSSCCGDHTLRRKEPPLTGWVDTGASTQTLFVPFMHLRLCSLGFVETPPRPAGCASFSLVCPSRIFRVQAFLKSQRAAKEIWKVSRKLEGTLSCHACHLF